MFSVAKYRHKRKRQGLVRTEVYVPAGDVDLVRAFAEKRRRRAAALAELAELAERYKAQAFWNARIELDSAAGVEFALRRLAKHGGLATARRVGALLDDLAC